MSALGGVVDTSRRCKSDRCGKNSKPLSRPLSAPWNVSGRVGFAASDVLCALARCASVRVFMQRDGARPGLVFPRDRVENRRHLTLRTPPSKKGPPLPASPFRNLDG